MFNFTTAAEQIKNGMKGNRKEMEKLKTNSLKSDCVETPRGHSKLILFKSKFYIKQQKRQTKKILSEVLHE